MARPKIINTGTLMAGVPVSSIKAQCVATLGALEQAGLQRPSRLHAIRMRDLKLEDDKTRAAYDARHHVQRDFDSGRKKRAEAYAEYIRNVEFSNGHDLAYGGVPAITLYCQPLCTEDDDGGMRIPFGAVLTAIDGETQTEARFILAEQDPTTKDNPLAFTLYHGIEHAHAKQILTDYNTLGERIKTQKTLSMNSTGPLTRAVAEVAKIVGVDPMRINSKGTTGTTRHLVSYSQMFNGMAGAAAPDLALKGKLTKITVSMNRPFGKPIESQIIAVGATLLKECESPDSPARKASAEIWQVAGSVISHRGPKNGLNWLAAVDMLQRMKKDRTPLPDKLRSIASVL